MRTLLLVAFTCFLSFSVWARQEFAFEAEIGWKGNHIELNTISSKDHRQSCLFVLGDEHIRTFLLDQEMHLVREFTINRLPGENWLGGLIRNGIVYLFLTINAQEGIQAYCFNTVTGQVSNHPTPFTGKHANVIEAICYGDHFLYLTVSEETNELLVHDFTSDSAYAVLRHQFEGDVWSDLTKASFLGRKLDVATIDKETEPALEAIKCANKLYVCDDAIYLVMNNKAALTRILDFNLVNRQVQEKQVIHSAHSARLPGAYSDNSILVDNKLYYVLAISDSLWVDIADLRTAAVLKSYKAGSDEEIAFKNTPITQDGTAYNPEAVRDLDKTKQLLRKMVNERAMIMASYSGTGNTELTIASYRKVKPSGGGSLGMGSGAPAMHLYGSNRDPWAKCARFKMLIDTATNEHVRGEVSNYISQSVNGSASGSRSPLVVTGAPFRHDNKLYYPSYDKKARKLVVAEF